MSEAIEKQLAGARHEIILPGDVRMPFRLIPAGEFRMGHRGEFADEEPLHRVVISHDFWIAETPVTQSQFAVWKPEHKNTFPGKADHPAEQVIWDEGREYCRWLTAQCRDQFPKGEEWVADLPDEARWEYACRAGTETDYHFGDGESALDEAGWHDGNAGSETHPVGRKEPNRWELYDMHGNVYEWCLDVWDSDAYRERVNGWEASAVGSLEYSPYRAVRGGSWGSFSGDCRSAYRDRDGPANRGGFCGFRVCLARSSPAQQDSREAESASGRRMSDAADGAGIDLAKETLPNKPA